LKVLEENIENAFIHQKWEELMVPSLSAFQELRMVFNNLNIFWAILCPTLGDRSHHQSLCSGQRELCTPSGLTLDTYSTLFHQGLNIISPGTHLFLRFEGSGIRHQCYSLQINIIHVELVLWTFLETASNKPPAHQLDEVIRALRHWAYGLYSTR
jgi:hypothetical protein